jgi:hypothetical protein
MSERATQAALRREAAALAYCLGGHGWERAGLIRIRAPYGMLIYVVTDDHTHDVPGFEGSGGSGFLTLREGIERIRQARRTMFEWARITDAPFRFEAAEAARDAVRAAYGITD